MLAISETAQTREYDLVQPRKVAKNLHVKFCGLDLRFPEAGGNC